MALLEGGKLRSAEGGFLFFFCPGCQCGHMVQVGEGPGPRWSYNGDPQAPVFSPSILTRYDGPDAGVDEAPPAVCHSFVGCNGAQPGQIIFLSDSTHALAGKTVDIPQWPHNYGGP